MREVSGDKVRAFRLRRSGLADRPFIGPEDVARVHIGVQAQVISAAGLAVWNRRSDVAGGEAKALLEESLGEGRSLVRSWGQRGTLHLYAAEDWPLVAGATAARAIAQVEKRRARDDARGGPLGMALHERALRVAAERLAAPPHTVTKDDVVREAGEDAGKAHYGAFLVLALQGKGSRVDTEDGGASVLAARERGLPPHPPWDPPPLDEAMAELARRFFSTYGPATEKDLRYWLSCSAAESKAAVEAASASGHLAALTVRPDSAGGYAGPALVSTSDLDDVGAPAPAADAWPVRLLGRFDPLLLAHADKGCWVDESTYGLVWHHTHVEPTILVRGRIVGTWRHARRSKGVSIRLRPFAGVSLSAPVQRSLAREAERAADYLGGSLTELLHEPHG